MKLNWKVRFRNKAWVLSFTAAVLGLVYQTLGLCGVVPVVSQDTVIGVVTMLVNLLVMLGVVIDPTTSGVTDSARALTYDRPNGDKGG